jgi:hypothetical protein
VERRPGEAEDLLLARADAADMAKRGYPVADWMFEQIAMLVLLLRSSFSSRAMVGDEQRTVAETAAAARSRMFVIRERLGAICDAVGFDSEVLSAPVPRGVDDIGEHMAALCDVLRPHVARLPDRAVVEALLVEVEQLVVDEKTTLTVHQLKRMLYDQVRRVSKQGLSAYPNDPARALSYRLERFAKPSGGAKKAGGPATDPTPQ